MYGDMAEPDPGCSYHPNSEEDTAEFGVVGCGCRRMLEDGDIDQVPKEVLRKMQTHMVDKVPSSI
jgi:hypothetical protein